MAADPIPLPLSLCLFGPFDVQVEGRALPRLRSRKHQGLLALLALRAGREVQRRWVAGVLWPESHEAAALHNLRQSLLDVRKALGSQACRLHSPTPHTLCLDLSGAEVDVLVFDAAIREGDRSALERAVSVYRGPLLEGCLEEWALQERQAREQDNLRALERLAEAALSEGDPDAAVKHLRCALAVEPLREHCLRRLMQALAALGDYTTVQQVYRDFRVMLHREMHTEPDAATRSLFEQIRQQARQAHIPMTNLRESHNAAAVQEVSQPALQELPTGTVTFLFSDIEGSTRLWEQHPQAMRAALARHNELLTEAIGSHAGHVFKTIGDGFCAVFASARDVLQAALAIQQALQKEVWPQEGGLRVRVALHTGLAEERAGDYYGLPLNRVSRLLSIGHGGQVLVSLSTAELVKESLPEGISLQDLGSHRLKDLTQPEQVFQLRHKDLPAAFPALRSLGMLPTNLPHQLTSFIGRDKEIEEVKSLLAKTRLLTLTGSGGCGKTRLSLQVAADRIEAYPDGVWLVGLAALSDPDLVAQTVASALGLKEENGRPLLQMLTDALQSKTLLLILDNCEHLIGACASLSETLLQACPHLTLLATSREGLRISGETTYRVPSLLPPDPSKLPLEEKDLAAIVLEYDAARLFVERASKHLPSFALTKQNAPAVASVCYRLDGIPLAIELAAARVPTLSVEEINTRLEHRFGLLTGGSRTALPRQQTLRALIDWSYNLLNEPERLLFRRLSVFSGGWSLEAAEKVCSGDGLEDWEVLDILSSLVEKSLVLADTAEDQTRYRLLETVRAYAGERLMDCLETEAFGQKHQDFYLALAEEAEPQLYGPSQGEVLDKMEGEHDNMRAALQFCIERSVPSSERSAATSQPSAPSNSGEASFHLCSALGPFWIRRGYYSEGRMWCSAALQRAQGGVRTAARAKALTTAGNLAGCQHDDKAAQAHHEEALAIYRELGDKKGTASSLRSLGSLAHVHDPRLAQALLEEALALYRELGDMSGVAATVGHLGHIAIDMGDYASAGARYEESLAISRKLGDKSAVAGTLGTLGMWSLEQGDFGAALTRCEESLTIYRELHDRLSAAFTLLLIGVAKRKQGSIQDARHLLKESLATHQEAGAKNTVAGCHLQLGMLAQEEGDYPLAQSQLTQALTLIKDSTDSRVIIDCLDAVADLARAQREYERAARLFGFVTTWREEKPYPVKPAEREARDRSVASVRAALGDECFLAATSEGKTMTIEQAINYALERVVGE